MKRRVGCILVKDSRVIATGYNGTPKGLRNCNEGGCQRCNEATPCGTGLDRCLCMHAEENALLEAGRERVGRGQGVILYCNTCPCLGKSGSKQDSLFALYEKSNLDSFNSFFK